MLHESKEVFSCVSSAKDWCFTGCLAIKSETATPNDSGTSSESCPSTETNSILTVIYDLNHASAVPSTPKYDCSRAKRIPWSMVWKAADRSSNTTREIFPSNILARSSLVTRVRAVSVLCPVRYAD